MSGQIHDVPLQEALRLQAEAVESQAAIESLARELAAPRIEPIGRKVRLHIDARTFMCRVIVDGVEIMAHNIRVETQNGDKPRTGLTSVWVELLPSEVEFF